jgi:predicted N-formylglutamate amidohydrolase
MFRYAVEILQRRVLKRWSIYATTSMKLKARQGLAAIKHNEDTLRKQADEIAVLQQQLVEARKDLVAEQQGREMLAQDMKRSFMRGVCALNMEAMQVCCSRSSGRNSQRAFSNSPGLLL